MGMLVPNQCSYLLLLFLTTKAFASMHVATTNSKENKLKRSLLEGTKKREIIEMNRERIAVITNPIGFLRMRGICPLSGRWISEPSSLP